MKMKNEKAILWCIIAVSLICLLPFLYICRYVYPVNDDYFYAMDHIGIDCFTAVTDSYMNWSGRYLATFISSLNPLVCGQDGVFLYKIASLSVVLLFFAVPFISFYIMFGKRLGKLRAAALGALFFITYMALCPRVSELFFWFSTYTAFTLPSLLALLFFSTLMLKGKIVFILQCILAFLIPGGNEVTAVLFVLTVCFIAFVSKSRRIVLLACLAVLGIVVVMMSPGNAVRMSGQLSGHPYLWTVVVSVAQTLSWGYLWIPTLLLATLVYIPLVGLRLSDMRIFNVRPMFYVAFVVVAVLLAHIPPTLGLSSVMTGRTANSLLFFFIPFYFFGIQMIIARNEESVSKIFSFGKSWIVVALAVFCYVFLCPLSLESPVSTAYFDIISGKAKRYYDIRIARDRQAQEHKNEDILVLFEPLGVTSRTLFSKDLETSPDKCFCDAYRRYHCLRCKVAVKSDDVRFITNYETIFSLGKAVR